MWVLQLEDGRAPPAEALCAALRGAVADGVARCSDSTPRLAFAVAPSDAAVGPLILIREEDSIGGAVDATPGGRGSPAEAALRCAAAVERLQVTHKVAKLLAVAASTSRQGAGGAASGGSSPEPHISSAYIGEPLIEALRRLGMARALFPAHDRAELQRLRARAAKGWLLLPAEAFRCAASKGWSLVDFPLCAVIFWALTIVKTGLAIRNKSSEHTAAAAPTVGALPRCSGPVARPTKHVPSSGTPPPAPLLAGGTLETL
jgi:hypothetical protein